MAQYRRSGRSLPKRHRLSLARLVSGIQQRYDQAPKVEEGGNVTTGKQTSRTKAH